MARDDTFVPTEGDGARQGWLDGFEAPVGPPPPGGTGDCDTVTAFPSDDPVALVVALDQTTRVVLVQATGPAGPDLADLRRGVLACPESRFGTLTVSSTVLPDPEVGADAVLAVRFDLRRAPRGDSPARSATQVLAWASVGPVVVGVYAVARNRDVDAGAVADALRRAVGRARTLLG